MPTNRRQVADDLAEDAHALLAGAHPASTIQNLEYRIQDLQEISDNENTADEKKESERRSNPPDA